MSVFTALSRCVVATVVLLLVPSVAQADPIRVTAGLATVYSPTEPSSASLRGDGLNVTGEGFGTYFGGPSAVGEPGNLDGSFSFNTFRQWQVTVDGISYSAFLDGTLNFVTTPFVTPAPVNGNGSFQTTFTMLSRVQGYDASPFATSRTLLFDVEVFGSGVATGTSVFLPDLNAYRQSANSARYTFTEVPAATPEPASLLLLGTGVAGLFLRRRQRP